MDLFFLYFLYARKSRRRKHTSCFSKFGLSAASQTGESRGPEKRCEACAGGGIGFAFLGFFLLIRLATNSWSRKQLCGCCHSKTSIALLSLTSWGFWSVAKGRLFRPSLKISLGLLFWFGNLGWGMGLGMGDGNASLFTSGHFWPGLGLGFSHGLGLGGITLNRS
jgi:hypothetical protein